ncbi:MAG: SRPBCC family protein [Chloroflexi bacterium]|nr:SRPBCC family protein [Chloroflexota bacterium]
MRIIPIWMLPTEVHIHADQRLAFEVLTAFSSEQPGGGTAKVLEKESETELLVEFHTTGKNLLGRPKTYRTVERVTLIKPEQIDFEGVEGPLKHLRDRITVTRAGDCCRLIYNSEFGIGKWIAGWLLGLLFVKPQMRRLMRDHLQEMKETVEARAKRSKVYPQKPCPLKDMEEGMSEKAPRAFISLLSQEEVAADDTSHNHHEAKS